MLTREQSDNYLSQGYAYPSHFFLGLLKYIWRLVLKKKTEVATLKGRFVKAWL